MRYAACLCFLLLLAGCGKPAATGWSGYAEGDYLYIAPSIGGRLQTLSVQAGQQVDKGAPLFGLDNESEQAAQAEAASRLASARAQAANLQTGRRGEEIAVTEAQLKQAEANAVLAKSELERQQQLLSQGFVARARVEDARTALQQAHAHVAELQAALRVARLPARGEERSAAQAGAQAAQDVLRQSQWRTAQKLQTAPEKAEVSEVYFRPGEFVAAGQPVVALLPPANRKARFFVPEAELGGLKMGQTVQLQCDGCGAPITARVSRIASSPEYTPPVIYSNAQRSKLVFMVEAQPSVSDAPRLKPGQPLDVHP